MLAARGRHGQGSTGLSVHAPVKRVSVRDIRARKGGAKIVVLTAYTAPIARLLDPYCDMLLVGDSLGMVVYGLETTLAVTLDMMIAHGAAVVRSSQRACVVVDLPFASYQGSPEQGFASAARIMQETGAAGVKLEGGVEMAPTIRFLVERGIPVMGHVGLKPQQVHVLGGYRTQGRNQAEAAKIAEDAGAVADAGAFSLVIEATVEAVASKVSDRVPIPTIGIGASANCDGQVLVIDDVLGMFGDGKHQAHFVKRYADLAPQIAAAAQAYADEVRSGAFPDNEHVFHAPARG